ncbi:MAG TPA: hypothetical protein VLA73_08945 [Burkholderiales bacterium]|jgi:hypothetical protein|nr:hypothetical protein [Burkholderiales bacterium]
MKTNYGDIFKKELDKARTEAGKGSGKRKNLGEAGRTLERLHAMIEELAGVGAPIVARGVRETAPHEYSLTLAIGDADYTVVVFNSAIKVHWHGADKMPMLYDSLSPSRLAALAKGIAERAVKQVIGDEKQPASARVIRIG